MRRIDKVKSMGKEGKKLVTALFNVVKRVINHRCRDTTPPITLSVVANSVRSTLKTLSISISLIDLINLSYQSESLALA